MFSLQNQYESFFYIHEISFMWHFISAEISPELGIRAGLKTWLQPTQDLRLQVTFFGWLEGGSVVWEQDMAMGLDLRLGLKTEPCLPSSVKGTSRYCVFNKWRNWKGEVGLVWFTRHAHYLRSIKIQEIFHTNFITGCGGGVVRPLTTWYLDVPLLFLSKIDVTNSGYSVLYHFCVFEKLNRSPNIFLQNHSLNVPISKVERIL